MIDPSGEARRWRFRLNLLKYSLGTLCGFYLALYEKSLLYDKCVCDGLGYLGLGHFRYLDILSILGILPKGILPKGIPPILVFWMYPIHPPLSI